jgi:hypothetical protein
MSVVPSFPLAERLRLKRALQRAARCSFGHSHCKGRGARPPRYIERRKPMSTSRVTTDHEEIRKWAEERGAKPAAVKRTGGKDDVGIIRLDFPGYSGEGSLEEISWQEFFEKFEEAELALVIQDATADGERSNFNKLVSRNKAA